MKYIDITVLNKADTELGDTLQKFGDFMAIGDEPTEDNQACTVFYLLPHQDKIYKIRAQFDKLYDKMSKVFDDILRDALSENDVEGMIYGDPEFIKVLHIVAAQLAVNDIRLTVEDPSRITFLMVSGERFFSNRKDIDWESNFKDLDKMSAGIAQIKNAIYLLATWTGEEFEKNKVPLMKFIDDFHESRKMIPDYDYLEGLDERQALTVKLVDMMATVYEMLCVTIDQRAMMFIQQAMMQSQNEMIQPVNADDAVPMDPADVEQLADNMLESLVDPARDDTPDVVEATDI